MKRNKYESKYKMTYLSKGAQIESVDYADTIGWLKGKAEIMNAEYLTIIDNETEEVVFKLKG